jgi:hypothetical protein
VRGLLRLNPHDPQGLRYVLAARLLDLRRDPAVARLLQRYPQDRSATWAYTRALVAFRRAGDTPEARRLLREAREVNPHIPTYLWGEELPRKSGYYGAGDQTEAGSYAALFRGSWQATPGALAWLRQTASTPARRAALAPPQGPHGAVGKRRKLLSP